MPSEFIWGPFTLQWSMIVWIVAIASGYGIVYVRLYYDRIGQLKDELMTIISNGIIAFIIVWKFGAVITDISILWTRPLGLLIFTGGLQETYYGILAAILTLMYGLRKKGISIRFLAEIIPWGIAGCMAIYQLFNLNANELNIYICILAVIIMFGLMQIRTKHHLDSTNSLQWFCISLGLGMLLITLFAQPIEDSLLSMKQIWLVVLVLSGIFCNPLLKFIDLSFLAHPNTEKGVGKMNKPADHEHEV